MYQFQIPNEVESISKEYRKIICSIKKNDKKNPNRKQSFKVECFVFGEDIASCATKITSHMENKEREFNLMWPFLQLRQSNLHITLMTDLQFHFHTDLIH